MPTINKPDRKTAAQHNQTLNYSKYYNDKRWRKLRQWYITEHPFCEECAKRGITKLAEEVHHKIKWSTGNTDIGRWNLLLDSNNLQSLCKDCHQSIHKPHGKTQ